MKKVNITTLTNDDFIKSKESYLMENYKISVETADKIVFKKNTSNFWAHIVLFLLFGFWLFLIPNLIYYKTSDVFVEIQKPKNRQIKNVISL